MKAVLPRQEFLDALAAVSALTGTRTPKPIFACVRIAAEGDCVELAATDGESGLRLRVTALSIKRPGVVIAPAERLLAIVRELGDVELKLESDERQLTVHGEGSEFHIFTAPVEDFPPVPALTEEADLVIDGRELRRMIALTIYAAARETSRYAINGILWEKQGKQLFLVATDGRRLARAGGSLIEARSSDFQIILPSRALAVLERVFQPPRQEGDWQVRVRVLPNQVLLAAGDRVLSTVLVEGVFPKYQEVIPRASDKKARIGRDDLLSAVRRAALLTTEESRAVKLAFDRKKLVITSQAPEQGDARIELPIDLTGDAVEIGFNPIFLQDALRVFPHGEVFVELQESFRPGVLCGEDKTEFLYVIMPVSL